MHRVFKGSSYPQFQTTINLHISFMWGTNQYKGKNIIFPYFCTENFIAISFGIFAETKKKGVILTIIVHNL